MPNKRDKNKVQVGAFIPRDIRDLANKIAAKYGVNLTDEILAAYKRVIELDKKNETKIADKRNKNQGKK